MEDDRAVEAAELSGEAGGGAQATEDTHAAEEEKPAPESGDGSLQAFSPELLLQAFAPELPLPESDEEKAKEGTHAAEEEKPAPESGEGSLQASSPELPVPESHQEQAMEGTQAAEEERPAPEPGDGSLQASSPELPGPESDEEQAMQDTQAAEEEKPAPESGEESEQTSSPERPASNSDEESHQANCGGDSPEELSMLSSGASDDEDANEGVGDDSPSDSSSSTGSSEEADAEFTGGSAMQTRFAVEGQNTSVAPWTSMRRRKRRLAENGQSDAPEGNNGCTSNFANGLRSAGSLDTPQGNPQSPGAADPQGNPQSPGAADSTVQSEDAEEQERWNAWRWAHVRNSASDGVLGEAEPAEEAPQESSSGSSSDSPVPPVRKLPRLRACAKMLPMAGLRCTCHMAYIQFCPARPGFEELEY